MFSPRKTFKAVTAGAIPAAVSVESRAMSYLSSKFHLPTFRVPKTPSKAALESKAKQMEGSTLSAEQFARTRKPFDMPVHTKLAIPNRRKSAAALMDSIRAAEVEKLKKMPRDICKFEVGDRIAVTQLLSLHEQKMQTHKGVVISKRRREYIDASFTIQNAADGVKYEMLIPFHSPFIRKIEMVEKNKDFKNYGKKLYYFRNLPLTDRRVRPMI